MAHALTPPEMLCFSIYAAQHAMQRIYRPLLDPFGITYPQYLVISTLAGSKELTVKALGEVLTLDSGTLTPVLKRLAAADLVSRHRNPADERQTLVALTPDGRALHGQMTHIPGCIGTSAGLSLDQIIDLRDTLTRLRQHLLDVDPAT